MKRGILDSMLQKILNLRLFYNYFKQITCPYPRPTCTSKPAIPDEECAAVVP